MHFRSKALEKYKRFIGFEEIFWRQKPILLSCKEGDNKLNFFTRLPMPIRESIPQQDQDG